MLTAAFEQAIANPACAETLAVVPRTKPVSQPLAMKAVATVKATRRTPATSGEIPFGMRFYLNGLF